MIEFSVNEGERYMHSSGVIGTINYFAQSRISGISDELVVYDIGGTKYVKTLRNFKSEFSEVSDSH